MEWFIILGVVLVLVLLYLAYRLGRSFAIHQRDSYWQEQIVSHRKDAVSRSRVVLGGQFSEQLAPFLPDYPYLPTETKFLGKPIDLLVFKGSDNKDIEEVVFVEVKSGKSTLNKQERSLKKAIENKKVSWKEYRIPEDLTKERDKKSLSEE